MATTRAGSAADLGCSTNIMDKTPVIATDKIGKSLVKFMKIPFLYFCQSCLIKAISSRQK
jgi:hypothetical protein